MCALNLPQLIEAFRNDDLEAIQRLLGNQKRLTGANHWKIYSYLDDQNRTLLDWAIVSGSFARAKDKILLLLGNLRREYENNRSEVEELYAYLSLYPFLLLGKQIALVEWGLHLHSEVSLGLSLVPNMSMSFWDEKFYYWPGFALLPGLLSVLDHKPIVRFDGKEDDDWYWQWFRPFISTPRFGRAVFGNYANGHGSRESFEHLLSPSSLLIPIFKFFKDDELLELLKHSVDVGRTQFVLFVLAGLFDGLEQMPSTKDEVEAVITDSIPGASIQSFMELLDHALSVSDFNTLASAFQGYNIAMETEIEDVKNIVCMGLPEETIATPESKFPVLEVEGWPKYTDLVPYSHVPSPHPLADAIEKQNALFEETRNKAEDLAGQEPNSEPSEPVEPYKMLLASSLLAQSTERESLTMSFFSFSDPEPLLDPQHANLWDALLYAVRSGNLGAATTGLQALSAALGVEFWRIFAHKTKGRLYLLDFTTICGVPVEMTRLVLRFLLLEKVRVEGLLKSSAATPRLTKVAEYLAKLRNHAMYHVWDAYGLYYGKHVLNLTNYPEFTLEYNPSAWAETLSDNGAIHAVFKAVYNGNFNKCYAAQVGLQFGLILKNLLSLGSDDPEVEFRNLNNFYGLDIWSCVSHEEWKEIFDLAYEHKNAFFISGALSKMRDGGPRLSGSALEGLVGLGEDYWKKKNEVALVAPLNPTPKHWDGPDREKLMHAFIDHTTLIQGFRSFSNLRYSEMNHVRGGPRYWMADGETFVNLSDYESKMEEWTKRPQLWKRKMLNPPSPCPENLVKEALSFQAALLKVQKAAESSGEYSLTLDDVCLHYPNKAMVDLKSNKASSDRSQAVPMPPAPPGGPTGGPPPPPPPGGMPKKQVPATGSIPKPPPKAKPVVVEEEEEPVYVLCRPDSLYRANDYGNWLYYSKPERIPRPLNVPSESAWKEIILAAWNNDAEKLESLVKNFWASLPAGDITKWRFMVHPLTEYANPPQLIDIASIHPQKFDSALAVLKLMFLEKKRLEVLLAGYKGPQKADIKSELEKCTAFIEDTATRFIYIRGYYYFHDVMGFHLYRVWPFTAIQNHKPFFLKAFSASQSTENVGELRLLCNYENSAPVPHPWASIPAIGLEWFKRAVTYHNASFSFTPEPYLSNAYLRSKVDWKEFWDLHVTHLFAGHERPPGVTSCHTISSSFWEAATFVSAASGINKENRPEDFRKAFETAFPGLSIQKMVSLVTTHHSNPTWEAVLNSMGSHYLLNQDEVNVSKKKRKNGKPAAPRPKSPSTTLFGFFPTAEAYDAWQAEQKAKDAKENDDLDKAWVNHPAQPVIDAWNAKFDAEVEAIENNAEELVKAFQATSGPTTLLSNAKVGQAPTLSNVTLKPQLPSSYLLDVLVSAPGTVSNSTSGPTSSPNTPETTTSTTTTTPSPTTSSPVTSAATSPNTSVSSPARRSILPTRMKLVGKKEKDKKEKKEKKEKKTKK